MSTACHRMDAPPIPAVRPGRCQATISTCCSASKSTRWLPANPAAPVTSVGRDIKNRTARHAAQPTIEGREVAQSGKRERQKKTVVGGKADRRQPREIVLLIFERQPTTLSVIKRGDAFLQHARAQHIVIE